MKKNLEKQIIEQTLLNFRLSKDYVEAKNEYLCLYSLITDKMILSKISNLDVLYKNKIIVEIIHSYKIGIKKSNKDGNMDVNTELYNSNIDDAIDLHQLYNNDMYNEIECCLKKARNNIRNSISNPFIKKTIESLFEIYDNCNYEIIKIAFALGLGISQNFATINVDNITSTNEVTAKKLKYCREFANLTQSELGVILDLDRACISNYERYKCFPKMHTLLKYSKIFKVSLEYFIDDNIPIGVFSNYDKCVEVC